MKTFLSIGCGPGIGFATAERFASEDFQVVLSARDAARTQKLADQLRTKGYRAEARTVDASDPSSIVSLIAAVEKQFGAIDVVHFNAAALRKATIGEQQRDTFNGDLAVNIGGALVAVQEVAPKMEECRSGTILLTGGGFALSPNPDYISLSIGKVGIRALALGLFDSFREKGIHIATVTVVAYVSPGSAAAKAVGEQFWQLHNQPTGSWTAEMTYSDPSMR
jgi:NAD(P)-dependent dehydrogenase (short-subunit alcohol dehydrogenase family)